MVGNAITEIETWACTVPLPHPIDLGNFLLRERSHLAVRVRTRDGLVADCVTQTRGSPLDVVVAEVLAPRLLGKSAIDLDARVAELKLQLTAMEFDGAIGRAWSAVEICLQSLRAQAEGVPLWRSLGGEGRDLPVQIVEGYGLPEETDDAFVERLAARVEEGYELIKIEAGHYRDIEELTCRLALFRSLAGPAPKLVLDFAWSWTNAEEKRDLVARVEEFGIAWIEDPFPRTNVEGYVALKSFATAPLGCGDKSTRPDDLRRLAQSGALDVLRLDATTIGGVGAVKDLVEDPATAGMRLSFHEHPEVHEHCILGFACADHVEIFPTDRPFDQVHRLIEDCAFDRVSKGRLQPYDRPGIGMRLNDAAVQRHTKRHLRVAV